MWLQKVTSKKTFNFFGVTDEKRMIRSRIRIRIHIKMSWIQSTDFKTLQSWKLLCMILEIFSVALHSLPASSPDQVRYKRLKSKWGNFV